MTTSDSHSILSRYSRACWYSGRKPNVVRSPEQMTTSGRRSLISSIARSSRLGTKYGPPQWMSEMCAMRKQPSCMRTPECKADQTLSIFALPIRRRVENRPEGGSMQYMLLIHSEEGSEPQGADREAMLQRYFAFSKEVRD